MNYFVSALLLVSTIIAQADVRLPALFSDHAVLQRSAKVPVWGWATAGEQVTVTFGSQKAMATTDADGRWQVTLQDLATGPALDLVIQGANTLTIKDVLVGEVWLGSGQSNMAMQVSRAQDFETEKAAATDGSLRMFTEASGASTKLQSESKGKWVVCSPDTVGTFSATLYFFGRNVQRQVKVPMGLINSSVGGTPIESWIDADAQHAKPELAGFFDRKDDFDVAKAKALYEQQLAKWNADVKKARADKKPLPRKPLDPLDVRARKANVGGLFNGKIAPLVGYAIRGAVWYQGEANSQPEKSPFYAAHLSLLVEDWRKRWGYDFPFAWVQLPNFNGRGDAWCEVREAMFKTLRLKDTGMAVTIDIGDPANIHPTNKQEVGRRLSLWALGSVYGEKTVVSGPRYSGSEIKGTEVVLHFTHADGGLALSDANKGFVIAGEDQHWHPATARIEGESIIVSSPEVPKPAAARYAWAEVPDVTLTNAAGHLPASPFRTDVWPLHYETAAQAARPKGKARVKAQ